MAAFTITPITTSNNPPLQFLGLSANTATFTALNGGVPLGGGKVVVGIAQDQNNLSFNNVLLGSGSSTYTMTQAVQDSTANRASIWYADVPPGLTDQVQILGNSNLNVIEVNCWLITGAQNGSAYATASSAYGIAGNPVSALIATPTGGGTTAVVAAQNLGAGTYTLTWTNASGAGGDFLTQGTYGGGGGVVDLIGGASNGTGAGAYTIQVSGTGNLHSISGSNAFVVASWSPIFNPLGCRVPQPVLNAWEFVPDPQPLSLFLGFRNSGLSVPEPAQGPIWAPREVASNWIPWDPGVYPYSDFQPRYTVVIFTGTTILSAVIASYSVSTNFNTSLLIKDYIGTGLGVAGGVGTRLAFPIISQIPPNVAIIGCRVFGGVTLVIPQPFYRITLAGPSTFDPTYTAFGTTTLSYPIWNLWASLFPQDGTLTSGKVFVLNTQ